MIPIGELALRKAIKDNKKIINSRTATRKNNLSKAVKPVNENKHLDEKEQKYLELLLKKYELIVKATPKKIEGYTKRFNAIIDHDSMPKQHKEFKDFLIKHMDYKGLRGNLYPRFFHKLGVRACVYCNALLTVTSNVDDNNKVSAGFEFDHYRPKSNYPCFSTSIFNLYPSCGSCNGRKSNNPVVFNLYSTIKGEHQISKFRFEIDRKTLAQYKIDGDANKLKIRFYEPDNAGFDESFAISEVYGTQIDLVEELIVKSKIYTESYKDTLVSSFQKLYKNKVGMSNRILIGNYIDVEEIHKRPMAKFTQDIAEQLGLI